MSESNDSVMLMWEDLNREIEPSPNSLAVNDQKLETFFRFIESQSLIDAYIDQVTSLHFVFYYKDALRRIRLPRLVTERIWECFLREDNPSTELVWLLVVCRQWKRVGVIDRLQSLVHAGSSNRESIDLLQKIRVISYVYGVDDYVILKDRFAHPVGAIAKHMGLKGILYPEKSNLYALIMGVRSYFSGVFKLPLAYKMFQLQQIVECSRK